jgi:hypothetical protein
MATPQPGQCPVCESPLTSPRSHLEHVYFHCPRCGQFGLTTSAEGLLPDLIAGLRRNRGVLSYGISQKPRGGQGTPTLLITFPECEAIIKAGVLPTPQEQADNLIRLLGNSLMGSGDTFPLSFESHGARIGAQSKAGFIFLVEGLAAAELLQHASIFSTNTLTFKGWERFEQLRRGIPSGRKAFMAMKFGDAILDRVVDEHFRPAVTATGFALRRLDDEPKAGLIDDRMRAEIQASRFVIVDLTHMNRGAYWEAGYAEGLGKPVIYTCEALKFEEASHFDTNHHQHVLWTENNLAPAVTFLKAAIRATIPEATPKE